MKTDLPEGETEHKKTLIFLSNHHPGTLSGGEQQRVGDVLAVMKRLAEEGVTMIVVTHELSFAPEVADRLIFFDHGRVVEEGRPTEMLEAPKTRRARDFIRSVLR